ncbi:prolyl oligopeptidase family serine peptidase [Caulobacter sp. UNC358MFTsu5.1]|uniref:S9 family peptidase n=1 Tax=Caulobacter sp. UNC358MFTsu5.1 TaxID=1449049 RepID=UPI00069127D3|nr:prolyl oligopeptidase family serine peptidase [Caulobacter sp. UNC358MFTsu5.1]
MRRLAPRLLACAWLLAGAAHADPLADPTLAPSPSGRLHPFGLDDLLAHESLGEVTFSPSRRWLVTQSTGPYGSIRDWSLLAWAEMTISRLDVVDLKTGGPPRRLFADAADHGYLPGPYSPSGDRMAVTRVRGHDRELGVVDLATGKAIWTGLTPAHNYFGATLQWRSERELIAVTQNPDAPSVTPIYEWQVQARLLTAWTDAAAGRLSVTPVGSGKYLGRHAPPTLRQLVSIDTATGRARRLLDADVRDLALSSDGARVAILSAEEDVRPDPTQVARTNIPSRRQRLAILDLATGQIWRPCPDRDVATGLMAWSPSAKGLLISAKADGQPWEQSVYWRIDPGPRRAAPLALGPYKPAPDGDPNNLGAARGQWLGEDPLVLARPAEAAPDAPRTWIRLSRQGPIALGGDVAPGADQLLAVGADHVVLGDGRRLWRASATGRVRPLADNLRPAPRPAPAQGQRPAAPPPAPADLILARGAAAAAPTTLLVLAGGVAERVLIAAPAGETVLAAQARPAALASRTRDAQGVERVWLRQAGRAPIPVLTLNARQADVAFARPRAVRTTGSDGKVLTHWLYLPPTLSPGARAPLVVVPYPGRAFPSDPARLRPPGEEYFPSVQILAAAGYAVLTPSLPIDETREPMEGTAERILAVVDAAAAAGEPIDLDRLALWGQSYGGYAVLAAATQSPRFKAVVASAASPDLFGAYGAHGLTSNLAPDAGSAILGAMGWLESGQARMGVPPWRDPQRYVRNSPLLAADKITAPILLISGDLDGDPNGPRAMFDALYRLDRDAILLDYHGEAHVPAIPANLRDLYARVLAFLADQLPPTAAPPGGGAAAAGPAGEATSPASGGSAAAPPAA